MKTSYMEKLYKETLIRESERYRTIVGMAESGMIYGDLRDLILQIEGIEKEDSKDDKDSKNR